MATTVSKSIGCDFIRQEMGGKFTLLGVYPNNSVLVTDPDLPVLLSFYIEILSDENRTVPIELQIRNQFNVVLNKSSLNLTLSSNFTAPLTWGPLTIKSQLPGYINCGFWMDGLWIHAMTINIQVKK
ncbi:hypothetical protein [Sphingobium sp. LSP13-1-1.1]|uniref:hypothetical protein n=1 Tax=Sphingobium sp. LSP13-1-1.1 TaxID=3135234 RepID=UPI0034435944